MKTTSLPDQLRWHRTTGKDLFILREQAIVIFSPLTPYVKTRLPIRKSTISRKIDVVVSALDDLRYWLDTLAAIDLQNSYSSTIYWLGFTEFETPSLLTGRANAQRLNENASRLFEREQDGQPPGHLDKTDLHTLSGFFFVEVKDTVSQIGVDIEARQPRSTATQVKKLCQRAEKAALSLATCYQ